MAPGVPPRIFDSNSVKTEAPAIAGVPLTLPFDDD
jgi:hypothetical protein